MTTFDDHGAAIRAYNALRSNIDTQITSHNVLCPNNTVELLTEISGPQPLS